VVFAGEHPGAEEDLLGEPMVGREGHLVLKLVRAAGLDPAACYFTYAVKCAPPAAAAVRSAHLNACRHWLWAELTRIAPRVVVALGRSPARLLLGLKASFKLATVAGAFHTVEYMRAPVAVWHSPLHILGRGRALDRDTIEFLTRVRECASAN
jgi:DNA polymerase